MVRAKYGVPETMHGHVMTRLMGKAMCKQGGASLEATQIFAVSAERRDDSDLPLRNIADVKHYVDIRTGFIERCGNERLTNRNDALST